ncbi:MAG: hypothetical protein ACFFGZ_09535 [Candidatus Thorarchaeota archaeon]
MQLTFEGSAYLPREHHLLVRTLMRSYQTTKRVAFNRLLEGQPRQDIVEHVRRYGLLTNARYIRSAIAEAQALIQSQLELVQLHYREAQWRAQEAHQRLTTYRRQLAHQHKPLSSNQRWKLYGLERRVQKTASKRHYWLTHWQNKTFPSVVFGGKRHLRAYQQGKLTKAEWHHRRNNGLYCVGEANRKGNANLRIHYSSKADRFTLSILVDGGQKGERLTAPLYVPPSFKETFKQHAKGTRPYTVRVQFPPNGERLRVLVASDHPNPTVPNRRGIAGIDLNPAGVAVTLLYPDGNFRVSRWFPQPELLYARSGQRAWRIGNLIKRVIAWIRSYGLNTLAVEDLRFSQQYGACHQFNRVKSNFVYRQLLRTLQSQALKKGLALHEINPAYTSLLGALKYARPYGLNGHQAAAFVIGRRGLGFSEKLHGHVNHSFVRLVVPPMEGWSGRQITALARDIDGLTAHLGNSTAPKSVDSSLTTPGRRQGSGGGIVPRSHTQTPGKGALACSEEHQCGAQSPDRRMNFEAGLCTWSIENPLEQMSHCEFVPASTGQHYEPSPSFEALGMIESYEFLLECSIDTIWSNIQNTTDYLVIRCEESGIQVYSSMVPSHRSGIISIGWAKMDAIVISKRLSEAQIAVSPRAGAIRASPHGYNTNEDIDRLIGGLKALKGH